MSRRLKLPTSFDPKQTNINNFFSVTATQSNENQNEKNNEEEIEKKKEKVEDKATKNVHKVKEDTKVEDDEEQEMIVNKPKRTIKDSNNSNSNSSISNKNPTQSPDSQRVSSTGRRIIQKASIDFDSFKISDEESDDFVSDDDNKKKKKKSTTKSSPSSKKSNLKRKKIESDDDYDPDGDEESDDDYDPDKDFVEEESEEESNSDNDKKKSKSKSSRSKSSSSSKGKSKSNSSGSRSSKKSPSKKSEENSDVDMNDDEDISASSKVNSVTEENKLLSSKVEISHEDRVLADGKVVLPAGTPIYQRDIKAGQKLIKAMESYEAMKQASLKLSGKGEDGEDGGPPSDAEEETPKKPTKGKNGKVTYTPLELQYLEIKKQYPDTVLMIEVGYKYRFFGSDAEIATKVLNVYSYVAKNFLNASVPVQRLHFHMRRLIYAGYKVGIVEQTETAALKAISSSKSQTFERKLTRLYTSATFVDDIDVNENDPINVSPNYLVAFVEQEKSRDITEISFIAVSVGTGEIITDTFNDDTLRTQLETRLTHLKPIEVLLPPERTEKDKDNQTPYLYLSNLTKKCIKTYCKLNNVRVQTMSADLYDYDRAMGELAEFYDGMDNALANVLSLPNPQAIALSVHLSYLKEFVQFTSLLKITTNFKSFTIHNHLILPHSTIENLEILRNEWDKSEKGSLLWVLNHTQTIPGRRLFHEWICKPLMSIELIKERQDAVNELLEGQTLKSHSLITSFLKGSIPDLQRNLSKIYYQSQCKPKDFLTTMKSFQKLDKLIKDVNELKEFKSKLLNDIFTNEKSNTLFNERLEFFLSSLNHENALKDEFENLWTDKNTYPKINETKEEIIKVEAELKQHLKQIRKDLNMPTLEYLHQPRFSLEYLIEVPISFKKVPKDWLKINATTKFSRYHPPQVISTFKVLQQQRELISIHAKDAWLDFLSKFSQDYSLFSNIISRLANLDCLFSLSIVGKQSGYVRPEFTNDSGIEIADGRHPIVEHLLQGDQYVPNSVKLSSEGERAMIITGPNMGGKSSFIRQTSLIVIMAQIGSNVPASKCRLGVVDAIFTRMGAHDNIEKGSSTFFIELQETSAILHNATSRSLVILDELGRGTSTHDGVAIAYSSLRYIIEQKKCFCLFVTHYPLLAELENHYPKTVSNYHMGFIEQKGEDESSIPKVIFLYQVTKGAAKNSYGLNVARIADIPKSVLSVASQKSDELKHLITKKAFNDDDDKMVVEDKQSDKDEPILKKLKQLLKEMTLSTSDQAKDSIYKQVLSLKSTIPPL